MRRADTVIVMPNSQLQPGDPVVAIGIDEDPGFVGHLLAPHTGGIFTYYRSDTNPNVAVWAVEDRTTGEVRFFRADALRYDGSD
jgi:hypothetical protein